MSIKKIIFQHYFAVNHLNVKRDQNKPLKNIKEKNPCINTHKMLRVPHSQHQQ
jgi:hypothetical protein